MKVKLNKIKPRVLYVGYLVLPLLLSVSPVASAEVTYDSLVQSARTGNSAPLLFWLEQNRKELSPSMRADWVQVANWAEDDQQVILIWESFPPTVQASLPERGVLAVARSYRNLKQWESALAVWEQVLQRHPQHRDARAGWIMSLADAGYKEQARQEADRFVLEDSNPISLQTFLYIIQGRGNSWDELFALTRLQDLNQEVALSDDIHSLMMSTMAAERVSVPALSYGNNLQVDAAVLRKLELDQAAQLVRMAHTNSRGEKERYWIADRALERYRQLLQGWREQVTTNSEVDVSIQHARIDRLGAYQARKRYSDVINEYESLQQQGHTVPDYAQRWAASAYLSSRQPDKAYVILSQLFADTPPSELSPEDSQELFFAALESERLDIGKDIAQELVANTPYRRYHYGSPTPQPNDNWLSSQVLQAHYLQKANRLDAAKQLNKKLSDNGPGNQGLRINLAATLLAQGLPRAAERQLKIGEVLEPANLVLEREQAYVAQALQEWRQFDLLTEDVIRRSADDPAVQELALAHQINDMYELRAGGNTGISSDDPVSGAHDKGFYSVLYGPRQYEHWRPFIGFDYNAGQFDEGKGSQRIYALGGEYTSRDNWMELELTHHNAQGQDKTGGRFSYWHDFNDHWRLGTEFERLSRDTPLRAIRSGVTSNQIGGYVRWYENERRQYQFNVTTNNFSDGNHRYNYSIIGKERLVTQPYLTIDLLPSLGVSSNSLQDGYYYSPKRDVSVAPTLFADHVLYRRYEKVWRQQFMLGAGYYWQQDYGGGISTTAGYGHRYATNRVFDAGAMLLWNKQPYDGKREHDLSLVFDINFRF